MRTQQNWAAPILRDANYNVVAPGTALVPNSTYYITLQALAPIASDNNGNPILNIIYLQSADGLTASSVPKSLDTGPNNGNWQATFTVTTVGADDLPERIYIGFRGVTGETIPNYPYVQYTNTRPIVQRFLP